MALSHVILSLSVVSGALCLSYNYFDEMAQSYCQSQLNNQWVFSLRRDCEGKHAPTCGDLCTRARRDILKTLKKDGFTAHAVACFGSYYIQKEHTMLLPEVSGYQPHQGRVSLYSFGHPMKSGGCGGRPNHCGPNYCCCKAYKRLPRKGR